jgi:hypothetical protein
MNRIFMALRMLFCGTRSDALVNSSDIPQRALFLSNTLKWRPCSIADFAHLNKESGGPRSTVAHHGNVEDVAVAGG